VLAKVHALLKHRNPEQIYLNPDCGFGTFADRPVNTTEIAVQKLQVIHEAAKILRSDV
jgi:5-methyltetrahydropteroyltriglutamate--homocysteine methyltransferase